MFKFISFIDNLINYEKKYGVEFDLNGFPVFSNDMFYKGEITDIIPYNQKHKANKNSAICFYEHDKYLYRKLSFKKLNIVSNELRKYPCFIGYDLSIFTDLSNYVQYYSVLCNLVIDMYLVLQGNRLIPNIRNSSIEYHYVFKEARIVCCGTIGCSKNKEKRLTSIKRIKEYSCSNSNKKIILYGPLQIKEYNIIQIDNFRRFRK